MFKFSIKRKNILKRNGKIGIAGISFRDSLSITFSTLSNRIKPDLVNTGSYCLVETEFGVEFAKITKKPTFVSEDRLPPNTYHILKIANQREREKIKRLIELEERAFRICKEKIEEKKLEMHLSMVRTLFDKSKIVFYYIANHRIDFRELVKDLASIFKTRIEMRQIGVRDEVRMHGGFGVCGRPLCCSITNYPLESVTLQMVKDQNMNLNTVKLSGVCGRLLCCIAYEHKLYLEYRKGMPEYGSEIEYNGEIGVVISVNILKRTFKARMPNGNILELKPEDVKIKKGILGMVKRAEVPESYLDSEIYKEENPSEEEIKDEIWSSKS